MGETVLYSLTAADVQTAERQWDSQPSNAVPPIEGEVYPGFVVVVQDDGTLDLQVLLAGTLKLWIEGVRPGQIDGTWHLMEPVR